MSSVNRWFNNVRSRSPLNRNRCQMLIEELESRRVPAASPMATLVALPDDIMIGEQASVTVRFDNTSPTDAGYGPFIDLFLPSAGVDGSTAVPLDGLSFVPGSATFLGTSVTTTVLTFSTADANGNLIPDVIHPYAVDSTGAPLIIDAPAGFGVGDQLIVFQLPFGSFTPDQPPANIDFMVSMSNFADLGTPLTLEARGGFQFGNDPLNNPAADPSIIGPATTDTATPTLITISKTYSGPEDETATGPNFPRRYTVTVNVADGQTVTDLDVIDALPNNLAFLSVISMSPAGTVTATPPVGVAANAPNNQLIVNFASVTGTASSNDVSVTFEYFVPLLDADGARVIDPASGDDVLSQNNARAVGDWVPLDPRDAGGTDNAVADPAGFEHVLIDKSIAIQKSVAVVNDVGAAGPSPGDTLEYTLSFQISDYFAFQDLVATDVFSDGQRFDVTFVPILSVNEHGASSAGVFNPANYNFTLFSPGTGETTANFFISNELVTRGFDGLLLGGNIPVGGTGGPAPQSSPALLPGTTGVITFRTVIQESFSDAFPSGDQSVDQGDLLTNGVTIAGAVLSEVDLTPTGQSEADNSGASVSIVRGALAKTIYAFNGNTSFSSPLEVAPGDQVTYRIRYTLPTSDFEDLSISDYLPLPIFNAATITTFDPTIDAAAPAVGTVKFGPAETFYATFSVMPTITIDAISNSVTFSYADFDAPSSPSTEIDLLFTVEASDDPFADRLFLTNQVRASEGSTNAGTQDADAIVQIQLTQPVLQISKGVVATDNANALFGPTTVGPVSFTAPGSAGYRGTGTINSTGLAASPIDSDLGGLDAGDLVTFAIIVENTGSGLNGAFNVQLRDSLPTGFVVPGSGLNLSVTDGTGAAFTIVDLGGGLFGSGIELVDPGPTATPAGALDPFDPTSGRNILVVTYDLEVQTVTVPGGSLVNTATLFNYAGSETGPDHTTTDLEDPATVTIVSPIVDKSILSTNQAHTTGTNVAIGELLQYQVTVQIPEGNSPSVTFVDTLDAGLAFVSLDSITASPALSTSVVGGFPMVLANGVVTNVGGGGANDGRRVTFNFGDIVNSDRDNTTAETITLTYTVAVINGNSNDRGDMRNNSADWTWSTGSASDSATNVRIVEPVMQVDKVGTPFTADAGDVVTYTLTVSHQSVSNNADAFNISLNDVIPTGLSYVPGSLIYVSGLSPMTLAELGGAIDATWDTFARTQISVLQFQATVDAGAVAGSLLTNTANIAWTSLPGDVTTTQSVYNTLATERTGDTTDPGGADNDYRANDAADVLVGEPNVVKEVIDTSVVQTENQQHISANVDLTIGETVTYRLTATLPEGMTIAFQIRDDLPTTNGILSVVSSRVISIGSNISGSLLSVGDPGMASDVNLVDGFNDRVFFNFGTLTNSADGVLNDADRIYVEIVARLEDVPANTDGDVLTNTGLLIYGAGVTIVGTADIDIVEPELTIDKAVSQASGDANDAFTYTLTISHLPDSTGPAFDLLIGDLLAANLTLVVGSVSTNLGFVVTGNGAGDSSVVIAVPVFTLSDPPIQITYQARLSPAAAPGDSLTNTATVSWDSLPGNGGRAGADSDAETIDVYTNSISGRVFNDLVNNGVYDVGDPAIAGVTITLTGIDHLGNAVTLMTTTLLDGVYSFANLRPGTYTVTETQPAGFVDGIDAVGTPFGGSTVVDDVISTIVIPGGASLTGTEYNFGEIVPASLAGYVYVDINNNGDRDPTEAGIDGVVVRLTGADFRGRVVDLTTNTLADGSYLFANLPPGNYTITETQPAGYLDNPDDAGTQGGIAPQNDQITSIDLGVGQDGVENNFGELPPSSISGLVYLDSNRNGLFDGREHGFRNIDITLTGTNDLGETITITTRTDSNGVYEFPDLRPGTYALTRIDPVGYTAGLTTWGSEGGTLTAPNGDINSIPLGIDVDAIDYLFSEFASGRSKWYFLGRQQLMFMQQPQNISALEERSASFTTSVSSGEAVTYQWQRLVDGVWVDVPAANSPTLHLASVLLADHRTMYRVVATDADETLISHAATLAVVENTAPTPTIAGKALYAAGQNYRFSGTAKDLEDRKVPASAYSWSAEYRDNGDVRTILPVLAGVRRGSVLVPLDVTADGFLRIYLTVRDSHGATTIVYRDVFPKTVQITVQPSVSGLQLGLDGQLHASPVVFTGVVGAHYTLSAPTTQVVDGIAYKFVSWSDRGSASHTIVARKKTIYVARFLPEPLTLSGPENVISSEYLAY